MFGGVAFDPKKIDPSVSSFGEPIFQLIPPAGMVLALALTVWNFAASSHLFLCLSISLFPQCTRVRDDLPVFRGVVHTLCFQERLIGPAIYRAAGILGATKDVQHGHIVPVIRPGHVRVGPGETVVMDGVVICRTADLFFLQHPCDIHRAVAADSQLKNTANDRGRLVIHEPVIPVLRIFAVAIHAQVVGGHAVLALQSESIAHLAGLVLQVELVLGLMTALPTTPHFVEYEKVYLLKNQFIREESLDTEAYLRLFFPLRMPDFRKRDVESLWNVPGEDRLGAALAMTFRNDPQAKAMSFMRDYGERFNWMKEVFRDWAFTFVSAFLYYHDHDRLNQSTLDLYLRGIACFDGNALSYHLELRDHTVMVWDFHSLMMAIKFLLSFSLTDTKNPLKMCENCQEAFIAKRADSQFCSADCRKKYSRKP